MSQAPVLANKNNYSIMVRTPEGRHINIGPGYAVAGPGFERYVDEHTLFRVGDDYDPRRILYSTPVTFRAPEPEKPKAAPALPPVTESVYGVAPEENLDILAEPAGDETVVSPPRGMTLEMKYSGRSLTLPGVGLIRNMPKAELAFVLGKLGLSTNGSKSQMQSRLAPLAGKTVEIHAGV